LIFLEPQGFVALKPHGVERFAQVKVGPRGSTH